MKNPKVSILCLTYNHEKYIKQALDSFLMQKTNFDFEVLIHDDASTDKTPQIIKEYQKKYPHIIKPYFEEENQYSKGVRGFTGKFLLPKAKGQYIALCEGDDYWVDKNKLQLQVNFMDKDKDYTVCFHPVKIIYENSKKKPGVWPKNSDSNQFNLKELLKGNFIQTNSVVYRKLDSYHDYPSSNFLPGDWFLHLYHAKYGKIGFINKIMSVYRRHSYGIWWEGVNNYDKFIRTYAIDHLKMYFELLKLFKINTDYTAIILGHIKYTYDMYIKFKKKNDKDLVAESVKFYIDDLINVLDKLANQNQLLSRSIKDHGKLQQRIDKLSDQLNSIQSSKTYKLWQFYCGVRKKIFGK